MKQKRASKLTVERTVALCYIRQSYTRYGEPDDLNSPDRQRANIQAACEKNGWIPEWYEDVGGHRSARSEKGRPQWLALKARLNDPDVVALVANDLARLHRKGWRIGDLVEFLRDNDVNLVLAAPGRDVDTASMKGRMFLQFGAIYDEFYAEDISQRAKDSIQYRKVLGKTIGRPPFGTVRDEKGYLTASSEGAWLLSNGKFVAGEQDEIPEEGAIWRSYYEAALRLLALYATGQYGLEKLAYAMNDEGWAFRDRNGNPRLFWRDDIRRVIANWPEYGGLVTKDIAKDRPAYDAQPPEEVPLKQERAVFPLDLLRQVGHIRQERTTRPVDRGMKQDVFPYPLTGLTYCAHCEQVAKAQDNPRLRSKFWGKGALKNKPSTLRYRHRPGLNCGVVKKSVPCEIYEHDFNRLIQLLTIKPEAVELMTELAIQADGQRFRQDVDVEKQKEEAIALCRRRIDAAIHLYKDGLMDRDEFVRTRDNNEREIRHWESRTTETEKLAVELAMCIEAVNKLSRLWDISEPEDRQGLAQSMFEYLVYDLDEQRITDFRLKPWADRFLTLRADLYALESDTEIKNPPSIGVGKDMPSRDYRAFPCLPDGKQRNPCDDPFDVLYGALCAGSMWQRVCS